MMLVDSSRYSLSTTLDWCYGGVNSSIPGNGGHECAAFSNLQRRLLETAVACVLSIFYTLCGWHYITLPATLPFVRKDRGGKRLLLVIVSLVFGMEIGYKLASKQLIYLLNPCHVTTALQIYLLAAPPSRFVTVLFRVHLNYLNGAVLAILFPVTNTRVLPLEVEVYWLQHSLMLVTPYYLLRLGGVYTIEDLGDFSWTLLSTGFIFLYHFLPLQVIGLVNLNNMLCPAVSDPFYGPNYRLAALLHQSLCIPLVAKSFSALATFFLTVCPCTKVKDRLGEDVTMSAYEKQGNCIYCSCKYYPHQCCSYYVNGNCQHANSNCGNKSCGHNINGLAEGKSDAFTDSIKDVSDACECRDQRSVRRRAAADAVSTATEVSTEN